MKGLRNLTKTVPYWRMWVALETLILINLEMGVDVLHKQSRAGGEGEGERKPSF